MSEPKTIQELEAQCKELNLPLWNMHIFIGQDVNVAKAFGIFKNPNTGEVTLYKNKADGTRAIRYKGMDEEQAVGELWAKIQEMYNLAVKERSPSAPKPVRQHMAPPCQTIRRHTHVVRVRRHRPIRRWISTIAVFLTIAIFVGLVVFAVSTIPSGDRGFRRPAISAGYYDVGYDHYYYRPGGGWYLYNNGLDTWAPFVPPNDWYVYNNYSDYYIGSSYDGYDIYEFDEWYTDTYQTPDYDYDYDSGYDSDSDYDSGYDWDNGYDWDSDWGDSSWDSGSNDYDYSYDYDSGYDWNSDW